MSCCRCSLLLLLALAARTHATLCGDDFTTCTDVTQFCCCDGSLCTCCLSGSEFCFRGTCVLLSPSGSATPSQSPSTSLSSTASRSPSDSASPSRAPPSSSPSATATASLSQGASPSSSPTRSPSSSASPTPSATGCATPTPSATGCATPTPSAGGCAAPLLPCAADRGVALAAALGTLIGCDSAGQPVLQPLANATVERTVPIVQNLVVNGSLTLGAQASLNFFAPNATVFVEGVLAIGGRVALRVDEAPPLSGAPVIWFLFNATDGLVNSSTQGVAIDVVRTFRFDDELCTRLNVDERRDSHSLAVVMTSERVTDTDECSSSSGGNTQPLWWLALATGIPVLAAAAVCASIGGGLYCRHRGWCWRLRHYEESSDAAIRRHNNSVSVVQQKGITPASKLSAI